jgi:hypothetical protein
MQTGVSDPAAVFVKDASSAKLGFHFINWDHPIYGKGVYVQHDGEPSSRKHESR